MIVIINLAVLFIVGVATSSYLAKKGHSFKNAMFTGLSVGTAALALVACFELFVAIMIYSSGP